jgi:hypothetical protein
MRRSVRRALGAGLRERRSRHVVCEGVTRVRVLRKPVTIAAAKAADGRERRQGHRQDCRLRPRAKTRRKLNR